MLVVLAMVGAAIVSHRSSDLHRRAQVVAEQIRASSQEMSALKWRTNTLVLLGKGRPVRLGRNRRRRQLGFSNNCAGPRPRSWARWSRDRTRGDSRA